MCERFAFVGDQGKPVRKKHRLPEHAGRGPVCATLKLERMKAVRLNAEAAGMRRPSSRSRGGRRTGEKLETCGKLGTHTKMSAHLFLFFFFCLTETSCSDCGRFWNNIMLSFQTYKSFKFEIVGCWEFGCKYKTR